MPSSSFGSDLGSSGSPAPTRKKRRVEIESSDDTSDAGSADEDSEDENSETDAARPLPSTEVTVLSHAERRRQRKKQKQQLASESSRKKRKLNDGTPSNVDAKTKVKTTTKSKVKVTGTLAANDLRRPKRQNSIWVGNLSFRTTQDALRGFFDGVGAITRIYMPMRHEKQENMGFAYIDFETSDAKVIAITLSEGQLDGRNLLIKDGDDFTGRPAKAKTGPSEGVDGGGGGKAGRDKGATSAEGKGSSKTAQKILRVQKQPPAPTLFLGNLGFETTEESIRELFEAHRYWGHKGKGRGEEARSEDKGQDADGATSKDVWVRKIRMGTFEDSGICKGFAFVDFTSIEHATEALINPRNHRLNGRDLVVEYASPDAVRRGGGPRRSKGDRDQKSNSGSGSGKCPQKESANSPSTKQRRPRDTQQGDAETTETSAKVATMPRSRRSDRAGHDRPHARRARPGAALAHAHRQSAAILPSQAQKIVF